MIDRTILWRSILLVFIVELFLMFQSPALVPAKEEQPKDTVATVNGRAISSVKLDTEISRIRDRFERSGRTVPESQISAFKKNVLERMIEVELIMQQSQKLGVTVNDTMVIQQIEQFKKRFPNDTEFHKALKEQNLSEDSLKAEIKRDMIIQTFINKYIVEKIDVSDEDTKSYYDKNPSVFRKPEQVQASHILIKVEAQAGEEVKTQAREKLNRIKERLKKGENFAALAKEFSEGPSGANGGDLGYFSPGRMVKQFDEVVFKLKKGEVSDIVETRFGYHLIKVLNKKSEGNLSFEEAKDKIKQTLKDQEVRAAIEKQIKVLKAEAKIQIFLE